MYVGASFAIAAGILVLAGCGDVAPAAQTSSGVAGLVHLGPQCPVETLGDPCADQPAASVTVTVSKQIPGEAYAAGEEVARATTDADGRFRIAVPPGEYVVTAEAGMSCELMDAHVTEGVYAEVDVPCDTGIR
jgi:outer membrane murein-binding lipoprotein Lpp